jgi:hypothetical protein
MIALVFHAIPWLIAGLLLLAAIWEFFIWRERFGSWREGAAISLGAREQRGDVAPRLAYEFAIDGEKHEGLSSYMHDRLPPEGEDVTIYYDPGDPSASEWFNPSMHRFFMLSSAALGLFIIWLAL